MKKKVEEIVAENNRILASKRDREKFFEAVFGNGKPNQSLLKAAEKYKSLT